MRAMKRTIRVNSFLLGLTLVLGCGWSRVRAAPPNDNFADRFILSGTNVSVSGSTWGATSEADEPSPSYHSVWWSWTAPVAGVCVLEIKGPAYPPAVSLYLGSSLATLTEVAASWSLGRYVFKITPGTTYQIAVFGEEDSFELILKTGAAPENDNFADRILLTGTSVSVSGSTLGATRETDEPNTTPPHSVWWSWTAPIAGVCVVETTGAAASPVIGVYLGSSLSALSPVAN